MSINVDYPDFPGARRTSARRRSRSSRWIPRAFTGRRRSRCRASSDAGWADKVGAGLAADAKQGAKAVKIWKNVGMSERDTSGKLIRIDDPGIAPVADQRAAARTHADRAPGRAVQLLAAARPDDARTTTASTSRSIRSTTCTCIRRCRVTRTRWARATTSSRPHPKLRFVGAHLGSLEYDVDRIAAFLDRYPNANVDMAARMSQLQYQSVRNYDKVRNFFIKYQDRLLYGTDLTLNPGDDAARLQAGSARLLDAGLALSRQRREPARRRHQGGREGARAAARGHRQDLLSERRPRVRARQRQEGAPALVRRAAPRRRAAGSPPRSRPAPPCQ